MQSKTFKVPNISCGHCVHTIQSEISDLAGVISVTANQEKRTATITYEPPATEEQIQLLLAEIDYPVAA